MASEQDLGETLLERGCDQYQLAALRKYIPKEELATLKAIVEANYDTASHGDETAVRHFVLSTLEKPLELLYVARLNERAVKDDLIAPLVPLAMFQYDLPGESGSRGLEMTISNYFEGVGDDEEEPERSFALRATDGEYRNLYMGYLYYHAILRSREYSRVIEVIDQWLPANIVVNGERDSRTFGAMMAKTACFAAMKRFLQARSMEAQLRGLMAGMDDADPRKVEELQRLQRLADELAVLERG